MILSVPSKHPHASPGDSPSTTQKTTQETTQELIIRQMKSNPSITRRELSQKIKLTDDGIKYHLNQLRKAGRIRHVGPTKSGHWEILK